MTMENRREKDRMIKKQAEHREPARMKKEWLAMAGLRGIPGLFSIAAGNSLRFQVMKR